MKWADVRILTMPLKEGSERNRVLMDTARACADRYNVPLEYRILAGAFAVPGFSFATKSSLKGMTLASKLIVIAHSDESYVGPCTPKALARELRKMGLRQVGLISFKCCMVGNGDYLEQLIQEASGCIDIGWALSYKGLSTLRDGHLRIHDEKLALTFGILRQKHGDAARVKVVRGNVPVLPPHGWSERFPAISTLAFPGHAVRMA